MARSRSSSPKRHRSTRHTDRHDSGGRHHNDDHRRRRSYSRERPSHRYERRREPSLSPDRPAKRARHEAGKTHSRNIPSSDPPAVGEIVKGSVHTVKPFGLFVNLEGYQRHGLVHCSQVSEEISFGQEDDDDDKIAALEYFYPTAAKVMVKVTGLQSDDRGGTRIGCSIRAVDQETGRDLDPENTLTSRSRGSGARGSQGPLKDGVPELNSVHKAEVASIKAFGAFVKLEGYRINGLVHVSQVSDHMDMDREDSDEAKVAAMGQVLAMGESCWVKVVEIKEAEPGSDRGPKLSCSIKLVSQRDGTDLDPHGLKFRPKPVDSEFGQRRTVGSDAGRVQQGQIDWGHLNAEKVDLDPKNLGYEILGAEVEDVGPNIQQAFALDTLPPPPSKGLKKQQKLQKHEKGITSVEEALAILKGHKKKSKHKKEKKAKKSKKSKKTKRSSSSDS